MRLKRTAGFSLAELMVALGVTSVLVVLMLRVFTDSTTLWSTSNDRVDTYREARAGLDLMARELADIAKSPALPKDFPLLALRHHPDTAQDDVANHEIYALLDIRNKELADLCTVGYRCVWNEQKSAYVLYRRALDARQTFDNLQTVLNVAAPLTGDAAFTGLFFGPFGTVDLNPDPSDPSAERRSHPIASYIWDFQVAIPDPPPGVQRQTRWPYGTFGQDLPEWIEIRFRAVGEPAARKLKGAQVNRLTWFGKEGGSETGIYQQRIRPYEQQFITRVRLRK